MFEYYSELISKPQYLLSESEKLFIDIFPFLCIAAVAAIICFIVWIVRALKKWK